ncbi:MAG TPA: tetratricopeptide repeat protein [Blastocatellia bacterium]|nr:tetratricopeptide repeat protein [Blastocatellia bacterium]HMX28456.1 tetratricopeptide repeat protein [Blastocatellia bacterium]HNG33941.1 tetratricopeptide repeat protein [Blastocatellia bacterium]
MKKNAQVKTSTTSAETSLKTKAREEKVKTVKTNAEKSTASIKEIAKPVSSAASGKTTAKPRRKVVLPIPAAPPAPPSPPRRALTSSALRAFEHAVKVFNRRQFAEAKSMFENLLAKFPGEVEIIARTQMYLQVCSQKLTHSQNAPHNADELYDRGVYALNIGDFSQAKSFFEKALRLKPEEPYLLYSLAATHAQTGAMEQALDYLKRTFQIQPRYRTQALHDTDFSGLRENKRFLELLGLASPFDLLQSRR